MSLPNHINAHLLLDQLPRFVVSSLLAGLNDHLAQTGLCFRQIDDGENILFSASSVHIRFHRRDLPLQPVRLESCLKSGLPGILGEDWDGLAARHRAAIPITVGTGATPAEMSRTWEEPGAKAVRELFDQMLIVCHAFTTQLVRHCQPLAVHWEQSHQLFTSRRFMAMSEMLFPLPLFIHPRPVRGASGETDLLGIDVDGSAHLIGRRLQIAPAPVTHEWLVRRALAFVSFARANGIPADGSAFGVANGERITVHHGAGGRLTLVAEETSAGPSEGARSRFFSDAA